MDSSNSGFNGKVLNRPTPQHWARPVPAPPPAPSWPRGGLFLAQGVGGRQLLSGLHPGGPGFRNPHQDLRPPRQDSELPNTKVQKDSKVSLTRFVYPERAPRPWCMIPSPILVKRARTGRGSDALRRPKRASIATKAKRPSADDIEALGKLQRLSHHIAFASLATHSGVLH